VRTVPPSNTVAPTITGTPALGHTLTCRTGSWSGSPPQFSYQWLRDGQPIPFANLATYEAQAEDQGHALSCEVIAANFSGTTFAGTGTKTVSPPVLVSGGTPATSFNGSRVEVDAGQQVGCPAGGPLCVASVVATLAPARASSASARVVGRATLSVAPDAVRRVRFALTRSGAALLKRRKHMALEIDVTVRHGAVVLVRKSTRISISEPQR
jgi:hypothetical protein